MDTRDLLLLTAEKLLGERGINGVSLREITRAAGQRNASALHYHFGSREGMIEAIFEKRMMMMDRQRLAMIEDIERTRELELRDIANVIARPIAEMITRSDGSAAYVRFLTEMFLSKDYNVEDFVRGRMDSSLHRMYEHVRRVLPDLPENILRQRYVMLIRTVSFTFADMDSHRQRMAAKGKPFDVQRSVENFCDMWMAAISAPVGDQTMELDSACAA